ncbi:MAG: hypothetical protein IKG00_07545 [Lachnospiraceae bacterium]|nr:hypothetical protein [Lachnospiraceae bacterium]
MPRKKVIKTEEKPSPRKRIKKAKELLTVEGIDNQIAELEAEIKDLNEKLKEKKVALKALQKSKTVAEKAAAKKKAEEDKATILAAVEASGKSVDEVLEFLKK